jgi:hypothetical protein
VSVARQGIALPFAATRGALLLVGILASRLLVSGLTVQKGNLVYHSPGSAALEIWARWDAEWYLLIAERGYRSAEHFMGTGAAQEGRRVTYGAADTTGFFPLFPLLIRALSWTGLSSLAAGVLISNAALLLALWLLRDLVRRDHGEEVAAAAAWVLLCFPTSLFLSAVYAESLMLACLLGALRAVRVDRPWLAGILGALCALSRPTGILVVIPLFDELLLAPRRQGGWAAGARAAALGLPFAALLGYMLYCREVFGAWAPFLARQARWRGAISGPWRAFARYLESPRLHDAHHSTIDLVFAVLLVASLPVLYLRLRRSYALYATAAVLLPLTSTLWSFSRFAATIFPFHVLLATLTGPSPRRLAAYMAITLPLLGFFMALYSAWWWVG